MKTMEDTHNLVNIATDSGIKPSGNQLLGILLDRLSPNSTSRAIVEPPQIEGSTVQDWLHFFIQNAFIFVIWLLAMMWVVYITLYHSHITGYLVTKFVNYLIIKPIVKRGYFKVASCSVSTISGKLMFRDLVYVNEDYSIRVRDGWLVFCYWIPYIFRDAHNEDLSGLDPRLLIFLNGLEMHLYNRSYTYAELEKLWGLPSKIFTQNNEQNFEQSSDPKKQADEERRQKFIKTVEESAAVLELKQSIWRDLFPVTRFELASGRFVFGNQLVPSSLSVSFEESHFYYTSRPAMSKHDLFTHILKGRAENLQVVLVPSPKHSAYINDEPPRFMGDGFLVARTNKIDIYYYWDEPGIVVDASANNDPAPGWGVNIKTGKGTDFSYGPWADRQRDYLYGFFFPSTYQEVEVSQKPAIGELRRVESFDFRFSTTHDAKIDILFSKNKETKALHINAGPGTFLDMSIPWVSGSNGYTTRMLGQILHAEATTSLQFRPLLTCESLKIDMQINYPRIWNAHQEWNCSITSCKATIDLIFAHKIFIQDLIDDWSDKARPDILRFVPYTWRIGVVVSDFELLVLANEHNWIDCSTGLADENCKIAICGEKFDMAFDLPFTEFLPPKLAIKIWIQGECLEGAFYLPECSANRDIIELLQRYSTLLKRDGTRVEYEKLFGQPRKFRNVVSRENHWHECMTAPIVALSITYDYWPMPPLITKEVKDSEITTPQLEEMLLSPLRPESQASAQRRQSSLSANLAAETFDPLSLPPDVMTVELEIGPMNLAIFGSLFMFLWNIKENYLGESQLFSEMSANFFDDKLEQNVKRRNDTVTSDKKEKNCDIEIEEKTPSKSFDGRLYRPFEVVVSVTLHEIQGHLVQCTDQRELYAPLVYVEKLCFELQKGYTETKLQLIISPAVLQVEDSLQRATPLDPAWREGFLSLSSLQFRGHAMFSNLDRPIESETLEYAWLVEVEVGEIGGRLTVDQLSQVLIPLENFFYQILQADIGLQPPNPFKKCLHDVPQNECSHSDLTTNQLCPYSEDVKYRMVRVVVNCVDIFLLESNVALELVVPNVKLATCNLHILDTIDGFSLLVTDATLRQFVSLSSMQKSTNSSESNWLESSSITTGPFFIDGALSTSSVDNYVISQVDFIKRHDSATKRLWFLWSGLHRKKCPCVGNSVFFGCNLSGQDFFIFSHNKTQDESDKFASQQPQTGMSKCYGGTLHDHTTPVFNPAYGESLLHPSNFLLNINSPLMDETSKAIESTKEKVPSSQTPATSRQVSKVLSKDGQSFESNYSPSIQPNSGGELSQPIQTQQSIASLSERFFSAEDISMATSTKTELDAESLSGLSNHTIGATVDNDQKMQKSTSTSWASPHSCPFSAEDITTASQYFTAHGGTVSSHKFTSASTSAASLQRFHSLSSASSSTLVSEENDDLSRSKEEYTLAAEKTEDSHTPDDRRASMASSFQDNDASVDLRIQLEKPIIDSALLMSAYMSYMSQYRSHHLEIPPPFPLLQNNRIASYFGITASQVGYFERLLYEYRHDWKTKFVPLKSGFSQTKLVSRNINDITEEEHFYRTAFVPGIVATKNTIQRAKDANFLNDNEIIFSTPRKSTVTFSSELPPRSRTCTSVLKDDQSEVSSKVSHTETGVGGGGESGALVRDQEDSVDSVQIYIQFREVELKISPLGVDIMSRFISSLEQLVSRLHPGTLLNHLSLSCQNSVEAKNSLKKQKLFYLGQLHMRAWQLLKRRQNVKHINRSISFSDRASRMVHEPSHSSGTTLVSNNLEVDKKVSIKLNVEMGRIAVNSIQCSIVEELVSFSMLDRVKDLTCVSVVNLCLDGIECDFSRTFRMRKILHTLIEQSSVSRLSFTEKALMTRFFTRKPKKIYSEIETYAGESTDAFIDELQANLTVTKVHAQLSRLVNSEDIVHQSVLTVIPYSKTKVDFVYMGPWVSEYATDSLRLKRRQYIKSVMQSSSSTLSKKNPLLRQSRILPECSNKEEVKSADEPTTSNISTSQTASMTNHHGQSTEKTSTEPVWNEDKAFAHYNRFIMFECGMERLSASLSTTSWCNAIRLNTTAAAAATDKEHSATKGVTKASNQNLNKELKDGLSDIPNKPIGSTTVKGEITKVWFHFASPLKMTSNSNQHEFTRYDWHLLSSAVPLAIAWISAFDRLAFTYSNLERATQQRITSSMACLMAKTLNDYLQEKDMQMIKPLYSNSKQLIRIFSSMAKTFQEDPSMHMINVLRVNFKNSFQTNEDFETYFANTFIIPNVKDLEKAIVVLLAQWKEILPFQISGNLPSTMYRCQSSQLQANKATTKNQLLTLFEEKTRQLNLAMANIGFDSNAKQMFLMPTDSGGGNVRSRLAASSSVNGDNESIQLGTMFDNENDTTKLLRRHLQDHLSDTHEEIDNLAEVASNITRLSVSDVDTKRQRVNPSGRVPNRVQFVSRNQARVVLDRFRALPVMRNISNWCQSSATGVVNSISRLRRGNTAAITTTTTNTTTTPTVEQQELQTLNATINDKSFSSSKLNVDDSGQELLPSRQTMQNSFTNPEEVRLNLGTADYDPYDSVQVNGRYSSYSNYGDKKDLYWWMVKQQDYMKNVANNLANTFRDYTKPTSNVHYFNLDQDITVDSAQNATLVPIETNAANEETDHRIEQTDDNNIHTRKAKEILDGANKTRPSGPEQVEQVAKQWIGTEVILTFEPLIKTLNLVHACEVDNTSTDFGALGSHIVLSTIIRQLCIDIDEPEPDMERNMFTWSKSLHLQSLGNKAHDVHQSAFVCEHLAAEVICLRRANFVSNEALVLAIKEMEIRSKTNYANLSTNVFHLLQDFEKKDELGVINLNDTLVIGFVVQLNQVIQRINLPLIRLVHQFSALYDTVVQTRFEMRSNRNTFTHNVQNVPNAKGQLDPENISLMSQTSTSSGLSNESSLFEQCLNQAQTSLQTQQVNKNTDCIVTIESPTSERSEFLAQDNQHHHQQQQQPGNTDNASDDNKVNSEQSKSTAKQVDMCWHTVRFLLQKHRHNREQFYMRNLVATRQQALANQTETGVVEPSWKERIMLLNMAQSMCNTYPKLASLVGSPCVVVGSGKIKQMNLVAMISNLKLEGDLNNFGFAFSYKQFCRKEKQNSKQNVTISSVANLKKAVNTSIELNLERTKISLFEDYLLSMVPQQETSTSDAAQPAQQLVVEIIVGGSNLSLTQQNEHNCEIHISPVDSVQPMWKTSKEVNHASVNIGAVTIDIPQHPVALHSMMTRSGRQLTTTLQELRSSRQPSRLSRQQTMTQSNTSANWNEFTQQVPPSPHALPSSVSSSSYRLDQNSTAAAGLCIPSATYNNGPNSLGGGVSSIGQQRSGLVGLLPKPPPRNRTVHHQDQSINQHRQSQSGPEEEQQLLLPFTIDFQFVLESFIIKASLLPSLRARYRIGQITSSGFTGSKAKFIIDMKQHSISLLTNIEPELNPELNIPTELGLSLPAIKVRAEYMEESCKKSTSSGAHHHACRSETFADGVVLRKGSYLNLIAEIAAFEQSLTTDMLNHLLFGQKVFMKEVNEVLQKVTRPDPESLLILQELTRSLGEDDMTDMDRLNELERHSRVILFSLHLRMAGIQLTATTPTNSAVRLETGTIDLHLSNRVMNVSKLSQDLNVKVFVRVQLNFNLALGQLIRTSLFEEAEPDFQQLAYFKTRISMRNTLKDEMLSRQTKMDGDEENEDKEVVLIELIRPLVYVQPLALDKAVLVWINYKNAYEYWNEQRANLNLEVIQATQQVIDKVQPLTQSFSSTQSLGTLFLQLDVNDFGICLPISNQIVTFPNQTRLFDTDQKDALVLTLESTRISACSRGSLVSKAQFHNLCIRFADDFETNLDDWKPNLDDVSIKNLCIVSKGTYEICSRTITYQSLHHQNDKASMKTTDAKLECMTDAESVADAKWILSVSWKMDGFDTHLDTSIGKHISALFKTLTAITGDEDDDDDEDETEDDTNEDENDDEDMIQSNVDLLESLKNKENTSVDNLDHRSRLLFTSQSIDESVSGTKQVPVSDLLSQNNFSPGDRSPQRSSTAHISDEMNNLIQSSQSNLQANFRKSRSVTLKEMHKQRSRNIERELNEQAKIISDLQQLGASSQTIQQEMQRYRELETAAFNHFRRGVIQKLKRSKKDSNGSNHSMKNFTKRRAMSTAVCGETNRRTDVGEDDNRKINQFGTSIEEETIVCENGNTAHSSSSKSPLAKIRSSTISIPQTRLHDDKTYTDAHFTGDESSSCKSPTPVSLESFHLEQQPLQQKISSQTESKQTKNSSGSSGQTLGSTMPPSMSTNMEPKVDFELDIKIFFNSGKCVLHTKDQQIKDTEMSQMAPNRNISATDMSTNSVSPVLSSNQKSANTVTSAGPSLSKSRSSNKLSSKYTIGQRFMVAGLNPDFTVFLIPGLDVKLHYNSKTVNPSSDHEKEQAHFRNPNNVQHQERKFSPKENAASNSASNSLTRQKCTKKAFLFVWVTLTSTPDEIFITPHLLDFLEEALKPIPLTMSAPASANATMTTIQGQQQQRLLSSAMVSENDAVGEISAQYVSYASFPVDVIVFVHCQPTIIRLGCLPVSRVECLLHVPSIDLMLSSKRSDFDLDFGSESSLQIPQLVPTTTSKAFKNMTKSFSGDSQTCTVSPSGGLSITFCVADFSLYIFHPYGRNKASVIDRSGSKLQSHMERKDSLSLRVEFVKINISRSRKLLLNDSLTQSISFSAICDIGTASFKYDVRRLNEILGVPKAWYRSSIWRKIFIGENTMNAIFSEEEEEDYLQPDGSTEQTTMNGHHNNGDGDGVNLAQGDFLDDSSSTTESLSNEFSLDSQLGHRKIRSHGGKSSKKHKSHMIAIVNNPWETLILLTVNFSNLNVSMNMGNVMGNTNWLTRNLMCDGSISIDSSGHRKFRFGICLKNSTMDAKGGIVGGIMELSDIRTEIHLLEDPNREPQHRVNCSLHIFENRIDYMGTSILMCRVSDLNASFHDKWNVKSINSKLVDDATKPQVETAASIHINGKLKWDQMQVLMSNSTTPDFIKIISKLEEFFTQQFHSGKRVFDSLHPSSKHTSSSSGLPLRDSIRSKNKRTQSVSSANSNSTANTTATNETSRTNDTIGGESGEPLVSHHRHWQRALQLVSGIPNLQLDPKIPFKGAILGGTIQVQAQNISLACFYGINFRSKSWAVFSLKQPSITFHTEAQHDYSADEQLECATKVLQKLSLELGQVRKHNVISHQSEPSSNRNMAIVCKISRTVMFPPQFKHLHEWFQYAFSPVEIDDVNRFPMPSPDNVEFDAYGVPIESLTSTPVQLRNKEATSEQQRRLKSTSDYKEELIFAFPSMEVALQTEHLQAADRPLLNEAKPKVECTFMSDFDDFIFVTVDGEAYFFLYDLINSYINHSDIDAFNKEHNKNEDEKTPKSGKKKISTEKDSKNAKTALLADRKKSGQDRDFREFICKEWHLEPKIRLHSWASKNIEPYGTDYVFQRLGFIHARTTIPKWIQRSTMDAIDKLISVFIYRLVLKALEKRSKSSSQIDSGQRGS